MVIYRFVCKNCGKPFINLRKYTYTPLYCSKHCSNICPVRCAKLSSKLKGRKTPWIKASRKYTFTCLNCKKELTVKWHKIRTYCSQHCYLTSPIRRKHLSLKEKRQYRLGLRKLPIWTQEQRLAVALRHKDKKFEDLYGLEKAKEIKLRLSKTKTGKNNPSYIHGESKLPYPMSFNNSLKREIRQRDGHTCQLCGRHESQLHRKLCIHHIDYNKNNLRKDNLISLCDICHLKTNPKLKRTFWKQYFRKILDQYYPLAVVEHPCALGYPVKSCVSQQDHN